MLTALDPLRQLNFASLLFRLALAMFFGGMIGMERQRKRRPAGFRTYMLVCLGATLAGIVSQYNFIMLSTTFLETAKEVGRTTDVSRIGAKVIGGIGFLGAGTVIVTGRQEVKGLTTAAGLWASACMGLAIGAGFYECVVLAFLLIFLCIRLLPPLENLMVERARNMNLYSAPWTMWAPSSAVSSPRAPRSMRWTSSGGRRNPISGPARSSPSGWTTRSTMPR